MTDVASEKGPRQEAGLECGHEGCWSLDRTLRQPGAPTLKSQVEWGDLAKGLRRAQS